MPPDGVFAGPTLNPFLALGAPAWREVRRRAAGAGGSPACAGGRSDTAELLLPVAVGDYVDFYSSLEHADEPRPAVPARRRAAAAQLAAAAGRLPRPRGHGRRLGHAGAPPVRQRPAFGRRPSSWTSSSSSAS